MVGYAQHTHNGESALMAPIVTPPQIGLGASLRTWERWTKGNVEAVQVVKSTLRTPVCTA